MRLTVGSGGGAGENVRRGGTGTGGVTGSASSSRPGALLVDPARARAAAPAGRAVPAERPGPPGAGDWRSDHSGPRGARRKVHGA